MDGDAHDQSTRREWHFPLDWLLSIYVLYLPCKYLFPLSATYYVDWRNHQWLVGYYGEYFRQHLSFPMVLNASAVAGLVYPVFYGDLFYSLLGSLSACFSSAVALRLGAIFVFWLQYRLVSQALLVLRAPAYLARIVGCLVIWAVYPLTNLYNRGAITEFVATGLLVCALALVVTLFYSRTGWNQRLYASSAMLCLTLSAATHPITAFFGIPLFLLMAGLYYWMRDPGPARESRIARLLSPWAVASLVCMAPWLLATARYARHLAVRIEYPEITFFPGVDQWLTRFYPVAFDSRATPGLEPALIECPYLDAQINVPLLILFMVLASAALLIRSPLKPRTKLVVGLSLTLALFGVFTVLSLVPGAFKYLPGLAQAIQFGYRFITYQNLALLSGVFLILMTVDFGARLEHPYVRVAAFACLLLSGCGVLVKWSHIQAIQSLDGSDEAIATRDARRALLTIPNTFYGIGGYTTPLKYEPLAPDAQARVLPQPLPVGSAKHFGEVEPVQVTLAAANWVGTDVSAFPWNALFLDGRRVPAAELRISNTAFAMRVPSGTHTIATEFVPDWSWKALRGVSLICMVFWCLYVLVATTWFVPRRLALRRARAGLQRGEVASAERLDNPGVDDSPQTRGTVRWLYEVASKAIASAEQAKLSGHSDAVYVAQRETARLLAAAVLLSRGDPPGEAPYELSYCVNRLAQLAKEGVFSGLPEHWSAALSILERQGDHEGARLVAEHPGSRFALENLIQWLRSQVELSGLAAVRPTRRTGWALAVAGGLGLAIWCLYHYALPSNLALHKPVTMSSQYRATPSPEGVTDGALVYPFQAHTAIEENPWIMVDLGAEHRISKVVVHNRMESMFADALPLTLELSRDGRTFVAVDRRTESFTGLDPWVFADGRAVARFVRVRGRPGGYVVLTEIEVYGR